MVRGQGQTSRVHYKGESDDFIIFVENAQIVKDWKSDKTIPLAQVVNGWKVFVTHKQGSQGVLDTASKNILESEFGTHKDEDVVIQILEKGQIIESDSAARTGERNDTIGGTVAH